MKIKYYDLIAVSGIHTGINVALMKVLKMVYENQEGVDFYAEPMHSKICNEKWSGNDVHFHTMKLMPAKLFGGSKMILRDALSCLYVFKAFLFSSRQDILIFSLAYPLAQYLIYLLSKLSNKKDIFVCLHGEMEVIVDDRSFRSKRYQNLTKKVLNSNSKIHYIVLGESIFKNLKHLFARPEKVIVIEHPYEFKTIDLHSVANFKPLVIGQIGMGETSKGTGSLFEIAKMLENEIQQGKLIVKLAGRLNPQLMKLDNGLVEYHTNFLDSNTFESEIQSLHFTLQLVPFSKRKVTASGSFFDTLKYQKPYLSLENEYIGFFHSKQPNSGALFTTLQEMAAYIKHQLDGGSDEFSTQYQKSIEAIRELQRNLSLTNIAESFKNQLNKV
ncbi:MAG TPA: hypothetical protein VK152_03845 [Paludibacter sp.]|nr:hypothetical protein [Paludibacter sp.]